MKEGTKKKLMFVKGEDYYFMSYNIFILLKEINCIEGKTVLQDYKKLAFLIDFVANPDLAQILNLKKSKKELGSHDKELLNDAYSNGLLRIDNIKRLLFSLEKKNIIGLEKNSTRYTIDVYLKDIDKVKFIFESDLYDLEKRNARILRSEINSLSRLKLETLLRKIFSNYGVSTWQVL